MPEVPIRVEAAIPSKVVFFQTYLPWTPAEATQGYAEVAPFSSSLFPVALVIGAVLLAVRNYWKGKGDVQGAIRLVVFLFIGHVLYWLLTVSHVPSTDELGLWVQALRRNLFSCAIVRRFTSHLSLTSGGDGRPVSSPGVACWPGKLPTRWLAATYLSAFSLGLSIFAAFSNCLL